MSVTQRNVVPPIDYVAPQLPRTRPTRHSWLAGCAWGMLVLETLYRGTVTLVAYRRSPTYPWARFSRNVGDPDLFIRIDRALLFVGITIAGLALLHRHRKRWAALLALAAFVWVLFIKYDLGGVGRR